MFLTVREYAAKHGVSVSTVQRRLAKGEIKGQRFGRSWYIELDSTNAGKTAAEIAGSVPVRQTSVPSNVKDLIDFSSKALNSYLMMSDRLLEEKEQGYNEKVRQLEIEKQRVAELESYVRMLERLLFNNRSTPALPATKTSTHRDEVNSLV